MPKKAQASLLALHSRATSTEVLTQRTPRDPAKMACYTARNGEACKKPGCLYSHQADVIRQARQEAVVFYTKQVAHLKDLLARDQAGLGRSAQPPPRALPPPRPKFHFLDRLDETEGGTRALEYAHAPPDEYNGDDDEYEDDDGQGDEVEADAYGAAGVAEGDSSLSFSNQQQWTPPEQSRSILQRSARTLHNHLAALRDVGEEQEDEDKFCQPVPPHLRKSAAGKQ